MMCADDIVEVNELEREMSGPAADNKTADGRCSYITNSSSSSSSSLRSHESSGGTQHALIPSLFSHVPPTINFVLEGEKREWVSLHFDS